MPANRLRPNMSTLDLWDLLSPSGFTVFKASGCSLAQDASPRRLAQAVAMTASRGALVGVGSPVGCCIRCWGGTGGTDPICLPWCPLLDRIVYSNADSWWSIMHHWRIGLGSLNQPSRHGIIGLHGVYHVLPRFSIENHKWKALYQLIWGSGSSELWSKDSGNWTGSIRSLIHWGVPWMVYV